MRAYLESYPTNRSHSFFFLSPCPSLLLPFDCAAASLPDFGVSIEWPEYQEHLTNEVR